MALTAKWQKSAFSEENGCVEARFTGSRHIELRDSKDPKGPALEFTAAEWEAFTSGVRCGEFDLPSDVGSPQIAF